MSTQLSKRLGALQHELDSSDGQRISFAAALFLSLIILAFSAITLKSIFGFSVPTHDSAEFPHYEDWKVQVEGRLGWLRNTWGTTISNSYLETARAIVHSFAPENAAAEASQGFEADYLSTALRTLAIAFTGALLRITFLLYSVWPIWIFAIAATTVVVRKYFLKPLRTPDVLGILDRGKGPFYSGIYGPLRPNHSLSGTDLSAPSFACPQMAPRKVALGHEMAGTLKKYKALNETNIELLQIILAYSDYPSFVEEERSAEENTDPSLSNGQDGTGTSSGSIITNREGTLLTSAVVGLRASLEAHNALRRFSRQKKKDSGETVARSGLSDDRLKDIEHLKTGLTPLGQILATCLTETQIRAISTLPPSMIATAQLACEAGKCLVFQKITGGFSQISRYPHLQARAVLQSLVPYHREYSGDARLVVRHAILSSRRHGDFGRPFIPNNMPISSRALRCWLEVLYTHPKKQQDIAHLTELDSHIEEINVFWSRNLVELLLAEHQKAQAGDDEQHLIAAPTHPQGSRVFQQGVAYKSVVLFPLSRLVSIALDGIADDRQQRILHLFKLTRKLQTQLSISARLPGFKRQAVDADRSSPMPESLAKEYAGTKEGEDLLEKWVIVRRMLIRYNWLSTRVGDETVPVNGLIQAVIVDRADQTNPLAIGLDSLVPLRQRRFRELLGDMWEKSFYGENPHPRDIEIYVDTDEFRDGLQMRVRDVESVGRYRTADRVRNALKGGEEY